MTTPPQPTKPAGLRYHVYVYFKCQPEDMAAMLVLQTKLMQRLQLAGIPGPRLQHRPFSENPAVPTQTWMEVYDEVDADFCTWLAALPEVQAIAELSVQGRHTEMFVSAAVSVQAGH